MVILFKEKCREVLEKIQKRATQMIVKENNEYPMVKKV